MAFVHGVICVCAVALALNSAFSLRAEAQGLHEGHPALCLSDRRLPNARLLDVSTDGQLEFVIDSKSQMIPISKILRWSSSRWNPPSDLVWLADGSFLAGHIQWKNEESFLLTSDWFQSTEWKVDEIRGLILQTIASHHRFAQLEKQMRKHTGSSDRIWNSRGEQISGVLTLRLRPAVDGGLPSTRWQLKSAGAADPIQLDDQNLAAIVFSPVLRPEMPVRSTSSQAVKPVSLTMRDGSRFSVTSLERSPRGTVLLRLGQGRTFESIDTAQQFISGISRIESEPKDVTWLSQIEPARYQRLSDDNDVAWPLGRDVDLFGESLVLRSELVSRAIVLHSRSQVAYRLDGRPGKFLAEASLYHGAQQVTPSLGSVQCKVLLARDGKLVEAFKSNILRASDPMVPIEIDLNAAQLLVLIAEEADQGPWGDHLLLRDARITAPTDRR